MSKSSPSRHVHLERRDFIVDDEEVRGLVRGHIVPPRVRLSQQEERRRALDTLEESENLVQPTPQQEQNTREESERNQRRSRYNRRQERSRNPPGPSAPISSSLLTSPTGSNHQNNMSLTLSDRHPAHTQSTASLLDSMERRTQRTYRYGIGLVCVGATLNWLGFAQGHGYVDPLRYLGVACVISGSFCVCLAMCRWLGRPISVSSHRVAGLGGLDYQDGRDGPRANGDVHVINVAVPMYVPPLGEDFRPTKPPDYDVAVDGEPPPYDEAIKLSPGALFSAANTTPAQTCTATSPTTLKNGADFFNCGQASPSHSTNLTSSVPDGVTVVSPCRESDGNAPTMTTIPSVHLPTNNATTLAPEIHRATAYHPPADSVVVVVDASESANNINNHHHNANSLNAKLGAPPPYTREYTPSPRRLPHAGRDNSDVIVENSNNYCSSDSSSGSEQQTSSHVPVIETTTSDNSNFVNNNCSSVTDSSNLSSESRSNHVQSSNNVYTEV